MTEKVPDSLCRDWLTQAPTPMLAVDENDQIRWANRALEEIVGLPATQLLGHTRQSLPSPTHRVLFAEEDLIHLKGPGAPECWLRCEVRVDQSQPSIRLHYYTDVTREIELAEENRELRETVESLRLSDELTGLPNQRALKQQLDLHVSRSRRYENPLSVIQISFDVEQAEAKEAVAIALAQHLRDRLRWADLVARWNETEFIVILPETQEAKAREVGANLFAADDPVHVSGNYSGIEPSIAMGIAGWQRGDDSRTILARAMPVTPIAPNGVNY